MPRQLKLSTLVQHTLVMEIRKYVCLFSFFFSMERKVWMTFFFEHWWWDGYSLYWNWWLFCADNLKRKLWQNQDIASDVYFIHTLLLMYVLSKKVLLLVLGEIILKDNNANGKWCVFIFFHTLIVLHFVIFCFSISPQVVFLGLQFNKVKSPQKKYFSFISFVIMKLA